MLKKRSSFLKIVSRNSRLIFFFESEYKKAFDELKVYTEGDP